MKKRINNALSEEEQRMVLQGLLSRKIWRFYELLAKWAPIPLMLGHWYGVWDYGRYPRPTVLDTDDNGNCIIWIYFLAYVYMPICMIPVSLFFRYCWYSASLSFISLASTPSDCIISTGSSLQTSWKCTIYLSFLH